MADHDPENQDPKDPPDAPSPSETPEPDAEVETTDEAARPGGLEVPLSSDPPKAEADDFIEAASDPHGWSTAEPDVDPSEPAAPDAPLTLDPPRTREPPPVTAPPQPPPSPPASPPPRAARRNRSSAARKTKPGLVGWLIRRALLALLIVGVLLPVASTLIYRVIGPPITILMIQRLFEGRGLDRHWVPLKAMSPALPYAVIAAEDARYCSHFGFDFEAMEKAAAHNQRRPGKVRGGSTISQQTAKNVFLWPQRSYIRKGFEAWFTVLIETFWGKSRIMEVYLNTIEWGPGIYGADAAARRYFGVGADALSPAQAARLAAILPSPLKWQAAKPGPYVRKRSRRIGAASGTVRREGLAACVKQD